jgi:transcriptional regulator with XRE-family HTH domain
MTENEEREGRIIASVPADTFSHRLMLARSHAGRLTIQDAATKCGFSHQTWSNWEHGKEPRGNILDLVEAIAEGLGIDRDWLLYGGPLTKPERVRKHRVAYARRSVRPGARRPRRIGRARTSVAA